MEEELRSRFTVSDFSRKNQLLKVDDCLDRSEDGLPMPAPTGAQLERTQRYALPQLQASDDLQPSKSENGNLDSSTSSVGNRQVKRGRITLPPEAESAWERYDKDKSGSLDIVELQYIIEDLGYAMSDADLEKLFDEMDTNKNGVVSKRQNVAAALPTPILAERTSCLRFVKAGHLIGAQYDGAIRWLCLGSMAAFRQGQI